MAGTSEGGKLKQSTDSNKQKDSERQDKTAIIEGLQKLREQQRNIVVELSRVEEDRREHARVVEVLKMLDAERKCYRMVGTTLVQHKIGTVIPILEGTHKNVSLSVFFLQASHHFVIFNWEILCSFTQKFKI
ncbi:unnamed protein product [Gongylonema pulchrum]|uniref:Prefoldin subunit 2 n=1 Tax=Gongylonema pulchrum TaxID=637853 RepID=A0A183EUF1_9BILA|nr:unnamed protein product [Gongylonema pulchrum]